MKTIVACMSTAIITLSICTFRGFSYYKQTTEQSSIRIASDNISPTYNYYTDEEELVEIQNEISALKDEIKEQQELNEETISNNSIVSVNRYEEKIVISRDPWRGPKNYKCNKAAGYPAICGYCGEQGEIYHNIKEWQDTQGTYHLTHVGCGKLYCDTLGVEPRLEESYKVR